MEEINYGMVERLRIPAAVIDNLLEILVRKSNLLSVDDCNQSINGLTECEEQIKTDLRLIVEMCSYLSQIPNELPHSLRATNLALDITEYAQSANLIDPSIWNDSQETAHQVPPLQHLSSITQEEITGSKICKDTLIQALTLYKKALSIHPNATIVFFGGMFHDAGKRQLSDVTTSCQKVNVGAHPGMREHPVVGWEYLSNKGHPQAAMIPLLHHMGFDGKGYPLAQGTLAVKDIPEFVSIYQLADQLDALMEERPYRVALPPFQALLMLAHRGGLLGGICQYSERNWRYHNATLDSFVRNCTELLQSLPEIAPMARCNENVRLEEVLTRFLFIGEELARAIKTYQYNLCFPGERTDLEATISQQLQLCQVAFQGMSSLWHTHIEPMVLHAPEEELSAYARASCQQSELLPSIDPRLTTILISMYNNGFFHNSLHNPLLQA